ncbi:hypothetical protein [Longispora albida]|uniref:hypothetical protein n=1 Tax=Longispora albida TaxID=203523 RepID=UPI00037FF80A|nr:hypothetical protein [Longispora albida]
MKATISGGLLAVTMVLGGILFAGATPAAAGHGSSGHKPRDPGIAGTDHKPRDRGFAGRFGG